MRSGPAVGPAANAGHPVWGQATKSALNLADLSGRARGLIAERAQSSSARDGERSSGISARAIRLIRDAEGYDQPGRWPGGSSGVTIGIGYDLGYKTRAQFRRDWGGRLPESTMRRLEKVVGLKGQAARRASRGLRGIRIPKAQSDQVFDRVTLPRWIAKARRTFPGFDRLNGDQRGALVSLVFNRGTSMKGSRRREMRQVRDAVRRGDTRGAAAAIRAMKRLWRGKGLNGLLRRRDAEARLMGG